MSILHAACRHGQAHKLAQQYSLAASCSQHSHHTHTLTASLPRCHAGANGLALMEAVHGTAPDIAGKDLANPTALLLSGCMMLRHIGMNEQAENIQQAVLGVIAEGKYRTGDLGGKATTTDFSKAIIDKLD